MASTKQSQSSKSTSKSNDKDKDNQPDPQQERAVALATKANAISTKSGRVSAENVKAWLTLMEPGNPVYEKLTSLDRAQVKRYADGTDRIPRDMRSEIKPTYSKLGSAHTWLKGMCRFFVAYDEDRKAAERKAKRASRKNGKTKKAKGSQTKKQQPQSQTQGTQEVKEQTQDTGTGEQQTPETVQS